MNTDKPEIKKISATDTWPLRQQVMWPNKPIEYIKLPNDNDGIHYALYINNDIVSVISIFIKDNKAQFRKFATLQHEQGKGYGSFLLKHVLNELSAINISKIWCNAREDKTNFYEKFDMIETEIRFVKSGINYVIMEVCFN